jgi:hypothetical protein
MTDIDNVIDEAVQVSLTHLAENLRDKAAIAAESEDDILAEILRKTADRVDELNQLK